MPICPCDLVKKVSPTGDEPLNFGHVQKLHDLGAPQECVEYVFYNFEGKTMKDLFPECYGLPKPPHEIPKFEITDMRVDKTTITEGETLDVQVWVKNTGNAGGTATVKLKVDGVEKARRGVYIPAGAQSYVSFHISGLSVGTHTICAEV